MKIINPFHSVAKHLGLTDAAINALQNKTENELKRLDAEARIDVSTLRSIDPAFDDPRIWNEIKKRLNLQQEEL